eukprot:c20269_g4_i1 orf=1145-1633(+)
MCQCIGYLIHSIIAQSCYGCRSALNNLYDTIQSWQTHYASVEVNLLGAAILQNPGSTRCLDHVTYPRRYSKRGRMGGCLSTKTKITISSEKSERESSNDTASEFCKHVTLRKDETRKAMGALAVSNRNRISRKLCINGTSSVASLFTQRGGKGVNQDAMIVW